MHPHRIQHFLTLAAATFGIRQSEAAASLAALTAPFWRAARQDLPQQVWPGSEHHRGLPLLSLMGELKILSKQADRFGRRQSVGNRRQAPTIERGTHRAQAAGDWRRGEINYGMGFAATARHLAARSRSRQERNPVRLYWPAFALSFLSSLLLAALLGAFASLALAVEKPLAAEMHLPDYLVEAYRQTDVGANGRASRMELLAVEHSPDSNSAADDNCNALLEPGEYNTIQPIEQRRQMAEYLHDVWLTMQVKGLLLLDDLSNGLSITVNSYAGIVQISGWLGSAQEASRAVKVASGVKGIKALYAALSLEG